MSVDHKRIFFMFFILLVTLSIFYVAFGCASFYIIFGLVEYEKFVLFVPSYLITYCNQTMCMLTFVLILYSVYIRFDLINLCIKQNFATQEEEMEKFGKRSTKHLPQLVLKLADIHDSLVDITRTLNHCFSLQMMNVVAGLFVTNIFSTFAIYRVFVRDDTKQLYNASVQYAWNIYFVSYGVWIITLASLMTRTGKFSAVLVHKAMNFISDDDDPVVDYVRYHS
jgi:hypothetical protein